MKESIKSVESNPRQCSYSLSIFLFLLILIHRGHRAWGKIKWSQYSIFVARQLHYFLFFYTCKYKTAI